MQGNLNQALHNHNFVNACCTNHPDNFFDWKVIATFYTAIHLVKAFCLARGFDAGATHAEVRASINPNGSPKTQFKPHAFKAYNRLQRYSEVARYDTFLDPVLENGIQKKNFEECLVLISELKAYLSSEGASLEKGVAA